MPGFERGSPALGTAGRGTGWDEDTQNPATDFREPAGVGINDALRTQAKSRASVSKPEKGGILAIRFFGKDCVARRRFVFRRSHDADQYQRSAIFVALLKTEHLDSSGQNAKHGIA